MSTARFALVAVCLSLVAAIIGYLSVMVMRPAYAETIVEECKSEGNVCYEKEVPALFPELSLHELFSIIREIRQLDPSYQYCHVLAHKLGQDAVAEDPQKWLDLIPLNPSDGLCSNGFIHGVIVGRFRSDTLDAPTLEKTIPEFARACEPRENWDPSGLDQAICYHGMGHLLMFITNADMQKSLDICERIAKSPTGDFLRVCREGVFMQIYQPLEPDDFLLIEQLPEKPTRENYRRLCSAYLPEAEGACLREAWPLLREEILSGVGVAEFCSGQPNATEEDRCYESVTSIIGRLSLGDGERAARACEALGPSRRSPCYSTLAQAILEEDRTQGEQALLMCGHAGDEEARACVELLASRVGWMFPADSPEKNMFCALLPEDLKRYCGR